MSSDPPASCFSKENGRATPTTKRKNGKTRSLGVHPCQAAWANGP